MSFKNIPDTILTDIGRHSIPNIIHADDVGEPTPWVRPVDWLPLPTVLDTEQKVVGLFAVYPDNNNFVVIQCITDAGTFTVDWGDGTSSSGVASGTNAEHKYDYTTPALSGTETTEGFKQSIVTVTPDSGNLTNFYPGYKHSEVATSGLTVNWLDILISGPFLTGISLSGPGQIIFSKLKQFQLISPNLLTHCNSFFTGMRALESVPLFIANTADSFNNFFSGCTSLKYFSPITPTSGIHTPAGITFSYFFNGCINLRKIESSCFDFSQGTDFSYMFNNCYSLTTVPDLNFSSYPGIPSSGRIYNFMFNNCYSLKDVKYLKIPNATWCESMFKNCRSLKAITLELGENTNTVREMFNGCSALTDVILNGNLIRLTNGTQLFLNCTSLVNAPSFKTSAITSWWRMFYGCKALKRVPKYDYSAATDISEMFSGCSSLEYIDDFDYIPALNNISSMFLDCYSLSKAPSFAFVNTNSNNVASAFKGCTSLKTAGNITFGIAGGDCTSLFEGCLSLVNVPAYNFNKVTNLSSMFRYCSSLVTVPLFTMPTTGFSAAYMLSDCTALQSVPLFNTNRMTSALGMFSGCTNLKEVPLFDFTNCATVTSMFSNCRRITKLPALDLILVPTNGAGSFAAYCSSIIESEVVNTKASISYQETNLSETELTNIFNNLLSVTAATTITITNTPIPAVITRTGTMVIGSTNVAMTITTGWTVGMQVTGNGSPLTTPASVTCSAGDLITFNSHPLVDGDEISFATLVSTTSILRNKIYYVVNATANTFQIALTPGGAPVTISPTGTGTIRYRCSITAIVPNVSITLSKPALAAGNQSLTMRNLPTGTALLKGWTVTG